MFPRRQTSTPAPAVGTRLISRRRLLGGIGAGAALTGLGPLAACSGSGGSSGSSLTFVYMGDASGIQAVKAQYAGFTKAHPDIKFTPQNIPSNNWATFANTLATRIAGGEAPDVIDIATEGLGIFRSKGLLTDLGPYIKKNQKAIDDYYSDIDPTYKKWADKFGNPGGTTYYMPGGFNTVCLYCNTDIFAKAGVDLPGTDTWTWEDFAAAAAKIKSKTGAYILPFGNAQFTDIMPWLLSNGTSTLNADWSAPVINSDAAVEAADYCKMMVQKGYSPKPGGTFDAPTAMSQGKLACIAAGRWVLGDFQRLKLVDKLEMVQMPMKKQKGTPIGWDMYPILKASNHKDDAWTFVEYLTTKESAKAFAAAGGTNVPARKSIALSDVFLKNAPKNSELLYQVASYATPVPSPDRGAESQQAVEEAWLKILNGNAQTAPTLQQLNDKLATLLKPAG